MQLENWRKTGPVSTIYKFSSGTNPNLPAGVMAQGQDGNFYGITLSGGGPANQGAIYKISPKGVLTSLHAMADSDGTTCSGLTLGTDGNFYGTCHNGGANDYGTLFKVTSAGALTVLHNFAAQGSTSSSHSSQSLSSGLDRPSRSRIGRFPSPPCRR